MNKKLKAKYKRFFDQALHNTVGVVIATDNTTALRRHLYEARKALLKEHRKEYEALSIITPHINADNELWIVVKDAPDAKTTDREDND